MYKCKYKSIFVLRDLEIATLMSCNLGCMHRNVICCLFRNASPNLQHLSLSIFANIWRNTSGSGRLWQGFSQNKDLSLSKEHLNGTHFGKVAVVVEWLGHKFQDVVTEWTDDRHGDNGRCALDRVPQRRRQSLCFASLLGSCPAVLDVRREKIWR